MSADPRKARTAELTTFPMELTTISRMNVTTIAGCRSVVVLALGTELTAHELPRRDQGVTLL